MFSTVVAKIYEDRKGALRPLIKEFSTDDITVQKSRMCSCCGDTSTDKQSGVYLLFHIN